MTTFATARPLSPRERMAPAAGAPVQWSGLTTIRKMIETIRTVMTIPPCWTARTAAINAGGGPDGAVPGAGGGGGVEVSSMTLTVRGFWTKIAKSRAIT